MSRLERDVPTGYAETVASLKEQVRAAQLQAQRVVNAAMIELYWGIGKTILDRQSAEPWGSGVLERLAHDLRAEFPHMKGFNRRNLFYMRAFALAWDGSEPIVQTPSARLSWSHNIALLEKLGTRELRVWYAAAAVRNGWSLAVLEHQISTGLHERIGAAPNNLEDRLPAGGADLAWDVVKDPLVLDFLGLGEEADERALEEAMTLRMSQTLAEFGEGFAFYGRQYHLPWRSKSWSQLNLQQTHVEVVRVNDPEPGQWRIQVFARHLLRGPQDFALVATGALTSKVLRSPL